MLRRCSTPLMVREMEIKTTKEPGVMPVILALQKAEA
jgi:hypothetical protein